MSQPAANILFCYSRVASFTNAVHDYVAAFAQYSRHHIHYLDRDSTTPPADLTPYDAMIFNYCYWGRLVPANERQQIRQFSGLKIAILQDEYDLVPVHMDTLVEMAVDIIVTGVPERHWRDVYTHPYFERVTFIYALAGYAPEPMTPPLNPKPMQARRWVLGYRTRKLPFSYGRHTWEKFQIGDVMRRICQERGVAANIETSEESRIYGPAWPEFLGDCRAVLGTESGSNFYDPTGKLRAGIDAYVAANPGIDFETVHARFMQEQEGRISIIGISPRYFETIAQHTALVLFEGDYSNILLPDIHYIPLKKDFSNVEAVLAALQDTAQLEAMAARAYRDIIASGRYSFGHYVAQIDDVIIQRCPSPKSYVPCYGLIGWRQAAETSWAITVADVRIPTSAPLLHYDAVPDPVIAVRFTPAALQRAIMRPYARLLHSPFGKQAHARLKHYPQLYRPARALARFLTGRTE